MRVAKMFSLGMKMRVKLSGLSCEQNPRHRPGLAI